MGDTSDRFFRRPLPVAGLTHVATLDGATDGHDVVVGTHGRWGTFDPVARRLSVRDDAGVAVEDHDFPTLPAAGARRSGRVVFDLTPGRALAAHLGHDRVVVHGEAGEVGEHRHVPWGAHIGAGACFVDEGRDLWVALPATTGTMQIRTGQLVRLRVEDAHVLDAIPLDDDHPESYALVPHPDGRSAVLDGSYGQDGTTLWTIDAAGREPTVLRLPSDDQTFGGFSPDGHRFVTAPHDSDDVTILSWPDATSGSAVAGDAIFEDDPDGEEPDAFFYRAAFVTDELVLAQTFQCRLLAIDATEAVGTDATETVRRVVLDGYRDATEVDDGNGEYDMEGDLSWFDVVAPGLVLTQHGSGRRDLWRAP